MTTKILRLAIVGAFLTTTAIVRAAIAPAENLLPADTIAFFTVPDCAALRVGAKTSPQLMFWNDPAMKPFHDKFMGKLTEKFLAPLEKDLGLKVDDFADLPQGQFTFAVTVNGSNGHDDIPPGLLLLLDTRDKSAQLKTNLAALTKKMTDNGRTLRTVKIRSLPFTVVTLASNDLNNLFGNRPQVTEIGKEAKPEKPVDIYFTQFESLLIAANSETLAEAVVAHLTGGSAPALADDAVDAHLLAAKQAAGFEYTGTLARTCIAPAYGVGTGGPRGVIPARDTWHAEPARMFDNLYFIGTKVHSAWALKGSDGIIIIDDDYTSDTTCSQQCRHLRLYVIRLTVYVI